MRVKAEHASNGRFYHVEGDIKHWTCECGQPNTFDRAVCLDCGKKQPKGVKSNKGRHGGK